MAVIGFVVLWVVISLDDFNASSTSDEEEEKNTANS